MKPASRSCSAPALPRRTFIQGLAAGGALLALPPWIRPACADDDGGQIQVLSGTEFDLVVAPKPVNFTGTSRTATVINGSLPAPTLRWREGDTVTIRVTNRLPEVTSIHWHGILLPFGMDGVPGISFAGIAPGETFVYRFPVRQSGTYWYHAHTLAEQTGMYGALIIDPAGGDPIHAEREYAVVLSDWSDEAPLALFTKLKKQSDYFNFKQPTAADFFRDTADQGLKAALDKRRMWNQMRMNPTDLSDISAYTYTYLMNGAPPAANWTALFRPGERVRLRFVDAGAATFFDVRIPGLKMSVVHAQGQDVEPVTVDEFRIGPGETYDVVVQPGDAAYTLFAQAMDRSGYARGTLAPRPGMAAEVPAPDKLEWLSMADMMGGMGGMAGMNGMEGMAGMEGMPGMEGMAHGDTATGTAKVRHARTEYGPGTDMRVDNPRTSLDDPGIGLRNNGRRVLTYADLHTLGGTLYPQAPGREIELHLTGNMQRFAWSVDGVEFTRSKPIHFRNGERLRVVMVNDTMMNHPFHLHGMWQELESPEGRFQARMHTINVQPAQRVSFLITADAPGRWSWHCHLFYHMEAGMFREVIVA